MQRSGSTDFVLVGFALAADVAARPAGEVRALLPARGQVMV